PLHFDYGSRKLEDGWAEIKKWLSLRMRRKRIAIVGAGHNALVCACYLARAGHDVTVFERRSRVGGAVNTEELWPGYLVDTCSVVHVLVHKTPIVQELGLHRFGLEYLPMD